MGAACCHPRKGQHTALTTNQIRTKMYMRGLQIMNIYNISIRVCPLYSPRPVQIFMLSFN